LINGTDKDQNVSLPYADWKTVVDDQNVFLQPEGGFMGRSAKIKPFSMLILQCNEYLIEPNLKE
jgi:hypothetical protein